MNTTLPAAAARAGPGGDGPLRGLHPRLGNAQEQQHLPDQRYGFITDYLAEAFHYQFKHTNRYEEVSKRIRLGKAIEGRDEKGIKKTVARLPEDPAPHGPPTDDEFEEYVAYAVECRRRVKEQMNKRKPDDEFARIGLSYFKTSGEEVVVFCPESKDAIATQEPARRRLRMAEEQPGTEVKESVAPAAAPPVPSDAPPPAAAAVTVTVPPVAAKEELKEQHFTILYGDTGYSYESIMGPYLKGAKAVVIEDPYIRLQHQIQNFVRFCETVAEGGHGEEDLADHGTRRQDTSWPTWPRSSRN
jgi:ATP-dependent Lon protease